MMQTVSSETDQSLQETDVVVIGAGMAGLAFACALAPSGVSITVIDRELPKSPATWTADFDLRVSALTHASEHLLRNVGAWPFMAAARVAPYQHMHVWDGNGTANIHFDAGSVGVTHLGHLMENRVTVWGLWQALQAHPNVRVLNDSLQTLLEEGEGHRVVLASGKSLRPRLVIGADGARSQVRVQAGLRVREWAYGQQAIVTTLRCECPHDNTAWQVFTPSGPLALLPLREQTENERSDVCSIVWSQDDAAAAELMALSDEAFCERLAAAFEQRLGKVSLLDRRVVFPLRQQHATHYVKPGLALIGDAAHTIHPLAGQGINLGFMDAATLAEELADGLARGLPLDEFSLLRRYQRRRQGANLAMMGAMEGFKRLFGSSAWALQLLRNWGMQQMDHHVLAKQQVVDRAMGISGDLPRLALPALRVAL